jgi:Protein of unknown function (DUF 659)
MSQAKKIKLEKETVNRTLGMFFFACNIPFSVVESPFFLKFVRSLDPDYNPPTSKTLKGTIMNKVFNEIKQLLTRSSLENGTLMLDGWKNSTTNTKTVTAIVKPRFEPEFFLKSFDYSAKKEDHAAILETINESRAIAREMYNIDIDSVCTDHASPMLKASNLSDLTNYGCKAHAGNLYVNDIHDKDLYTSVHEIMIIFRNTKMQAILLSLGGTKIYLAGATRWKGVRDEEQCFLENFSKMRNVPIAIEPFNRRYNFLYMIRRKRLTLFFFFSVIQNLNDDNFIEKVKKEVTTLDSLCEFIDCVQSRECSLADGIHKWLELPPIDGHHVDWLKRDKMICELPALLSYSFHPSYKGRLLSDQQKQIVKTHLYNNGRGEKLLSDFEKFSKGS